MGTGPNCTVQFGPVPNLHQAPNCTNQSLKKAGILRVDLGEYVSGMIHQRLATWEKEGHSKYICDNRHQCDDDCKVSKFGGDSSFYISLPEKHGRENYPQRISGVVFKGLKRMHCKKSNEGSGKTTSGTG